MSSTRTQNLVQAPIESVYAIVADIESYPDFIPACHSSKIISRTMDGDRELVKAELRVRLGPVRKSFTTSNINLINTSISIGLDSGQMRQLEGIWTFSAVDSGSTLVSFDLKFNFGATSLNKMVEKALQKFMIQLSQAFIERARALGLGHGAD